MPSQVCAACGSGDTGAMLDTFVCHNCGAVTNYKGEQVSPPTVTVGVVAPPVVTVSPADTTDPTNPTRTVSTKAPGDQFVSTETVGADSPQTIIGPQQLVDEQGDHRDPGEGQAVNTDQPATDTSIPSGESVSDVTPSTSHTAPETPDSGVTEESGEAVSGSAGQPSPESAPAGPPDGATT